MLEGVLFDIDDTLVDTRGAFAHTMEVLSARFLPELAHERHPEVLELWRRDPNGHYRAYTRGELSARDQRMARANELQATFGGELFDAAGFEQWNEVFQAAFREGWQAFSDAAPAVTALRQAGIAVGALSNAPRTMQVDKLARTGLGDIEVLVTLDTFGVGKPDPRVFLEACRLLGTDPQRTAYVGDELDIDARGAAAVGMTGVWLDRPGARRGGVHLEDVTVATAEGLHVVESLALVPQVLGVTVSL